MENQKSFPDQRTYNEAPPPFSLALWSATVLCRFLNAGMLAPRIEFGINLVILVASQERRSVRRMPTQIATNETADYAVQSGRALPHSKTWR